MDELPSVVIWSLQGDCRLMYYVFLLVKTLFQSHGSAGDHGDQL